MRKGGREGELGEEDGPACPCAAIFTPSPCGIMVSGPPPAQRSSDLEAKASASTSDVDYARFTRTKTPWARRVMPFERIVEHEYQGKGTAEEPYLVIWLDGDAEDPFNKSSLEKWTLAVFVSVATLAVALASSIYSGCTAAIAADLGGSDTVITLGISLFVLGFALGPLIWGPLSEMTGRRNLFLISYSFFTLWNGVAIASPNLAALLVFRFLAGAFGSSPLAVSGWCGVRGYCMHAHRSSSARTRGEQSQTSFEPRSEDWPWLSLPWPPFSAQPWAPSRAASSARA